jgi:membrane protease YdiL (CAAX protease family)
MMSETLPAPTSDSDKSPTMRTTLMTLGAGLLVSVVIFGGTILLLLNVAALKQWAATFVVVAITIHALAMFAVIWHFLRRSSITLTALGFSRPTRRLLHLLWQVPAVLIALLAAQLLMFAVTGSPARSSGLDDLAARVNLPVAVMLFVAAAVLTPIWEEMLFRGMIQGSARTRFGRFAGVVISALVFAAAHGVLVLLPYMITLGIGLGLLREFHRNLWGPLVMHCTLNAIASLAVLAALT